MPGYRPSVPMPLFGYFTVVTPCLLGLLLVAAQAFDATPLRMDRVAPILPGSRVRVAAASLPILTVREAPAPPAWALTAPDDSAMAQRHEPTQPAVAKTADAQRKKIARAQSKKPVRQAQPQHAAQRYVANAVPSSYGRIW